jgi:predicted Zn finger-like uncharacterized protein
VLRHEPRPSKPNSHGIIDGMSLAARCPQCSTVFRVVQDQLLVSEGWVRCGRCREVFNAIESLFELQRDPIATTKVDTEPPPSVVPQTITDPISIDFDPTRSSDSELRDQRDLQAARASQSSGWGEDGPASGFGLPVEGDGAASEGSQPSAQTAAESPSNSTAVTRKSPRSRTRKRKPKSLALRKDGEDFQLSETTLDVVHEGMAAPEPIDEQVVDRMLASNDRDTTFVAWEPQPEFVIRARKASTTESWWRQSRVRLALRVSAILLTVGLGFQWAMHSRDMLAARHPSFEPALQTLCVPFGCRVEAPRLPRALSVESVTLSDAGVAGSYRLTVVLRNQADVRVRMPALDVLLSDSRNETLARRIVSATELGVTQAAIEVGAEATLQGDLRFTQGTIAGYQVTVFYP